MSNRHKLTSALALTVVGLAALDPLMLGLTASVRAADDLPEVP